MSDDKPKSFNDVKAHDDAGGFARHSPPPVASGELLSGWVVVMRPVDKRINSVAESLVPVAAFPNEEMAKGWISEAAHRRRDVVRLLNTEASGAKKSNV